METIDLSQKAARLKPLLYKVGKAFCPGSTFTEKDVGVRLQIDALENTVVTIKVPMQMATSSMSDAFPDHPAYNDIGIPGVKLGLIEKHAGPNGSYSCEFVGKEKAIGEFLDAYTAAFRREEQAIDAAAKGNVRGA